MIISFWYGGQKTLIKKDEFKYINEDWVRWFPATKKEIMMYNKGIRMYRPKMSSSYINNGDFDKCVRFESNYFSQGKSYNLRSRAKRALKIAHKMGYYDIERRWCKYLNLIDKKEVKKQRTRDKKTYRGW